MTSEPQRSSSREQFARSLVEDVYFVDQLEAAGLLVLASDGHRVLVPETLARIEANRDAVSRIERVRTASFAGFARLLGNRRASYVTQLKGEGRLVLTEDGKRVQVDASLALIRSTSDPAKAGVVARHAAARDDAAPAAAAPPAQAPRDAQDGEAGDGWMPPEGGHQLRRAKALADKEEALAERARRENLVEMGKLLPADQVDAALFAAGTTLRTSLENLPNTLAPELTAARDEGRVRVILGEAIEHALEEISRAFSTIARSEESA
jgi:hypothetical protein